MVPGKTVLTSYNPIGTQRMYYRVIAVTLPIFLSTKIRSHYPRFHTIQFRPLYPI